MERTLSWRIHRPSSKVIDVTGPKARAEKMADDPIGKELETLKADISRLRQDIAHLTEAVRTVAQDKAAETKERAQNRVQEGWEELEAKLDSLLGQGREALEGAQERVSEHPLGSLLTAFSLGFIIGKLMDLGGRR